MEPRIKTSQRWSQFPDEYLKNILDLLNDHFKTESKKGNFVANGHIYRKELLFMAGYLPSGRLRQANFYVSIEMDTTKDNPLDLIQMAVNVGAQLLASYFESEKEPTTRKNATIGKDPKDLWPLEWTAVEDSPELKKFQVFVRHDTTNSELEDAADKLLGIETENKLVHGEDEANDEVVAAIKSSLGLDEEAAPETEVVDEKKPSSNTKKGQGSGGETIH